MSVQKITRDVSNRTGIIGCSQLGALMNVSSYGTPYTVYKAYIGEKQENFSKEQLESMDMGSFFEETIARYIAKKFDVKLRRSNKAYVCPEVPQLICHPDRLVVGKINGLRIGVEIKQVSPYSQDWGTPDTDQVPDDYLLQSEGYFACDVCDVVWLCKMQGNRITRYIIKPDNELVKSIIVEAKTFVKKVESGFEYKPDSYELVKKQWEISEPTTITTNEQVSKDIEVLKEVNSQISKLEKKADALKACIISYMQENETIINEFGKTLFSYKSQSRTSVDSNWLKENHFKIYQQSLKTISFRKPYIPKK